MKKKIMLQTLKKIQKDEREMFKKMDAEIEERLRKRAQEKLKTHFKIIAGGYAIRALNFDINKFMSMSKETRDEAFTAEFTIAINKFMARRVPKTPD